MKQKVKIKKVISVTLIILIAWTSVASTALAAAGDSPERKISGTVKLPEGIQLEKDLSFYIKLINSMGTVDKNDDFRQSVELIIPAGQNSVEFQVNVPNTASPFELSYFGVNLNGCLDFGYYNSAGTVSKDSLAENIIVSEGDVGNIEFPLYKSKLIQGKVMLPDGETAPESGYNIALSAISGEGTKDDFEDDHTFVGSVNIPKGQSQADYTLNVLDGLAYTVGYQIPVDNTEYIKKGYYADAGTVTQKKRSTPVEMGASDIYINLSLVKGMKMRGQISLPGGMAAPSGGINISVTAMSNNGTQTDIGDDYSASAQVNIPQEVSSGSYELTIDPSQSTGYTLECTVPENGMDLLSPCYYRTSGTVFRKELAEIIGIGNQGVENINLTLKKGIRVNGKVSLPVEELAPQYGYDMTVSAVKANTDLAGKDVEIPEGSNSIDYSLLIDPDCLNGVKIEYALKDEEGKLPYLNNGYYCSSGTVSTMEEAQEINSIDDQSQFDLELLKAGFIKGNVSLPQGEVAPVGGLQMSVIANSTTDADSSQNADSAFTQATIEQGSSSSSYSIKVIPEKSYYVNFLIDKPGSPYLKQGFYSLNGTVLSEKGSTPVNSILGAVNDINMMLAKGAKIQGTVTIPEGASIPDEGMSLSVIAITDNGTKEDIYDDYTGVDSVRLSKGDTKADYEMWVDPNKQGGYIVQYNIAKSDLGLINTGYYSTTGTVFKRDMASFINVPPEGVDSINLDLGTGKNIKGLVKLPGGEVAPEGGLNVAVTISSYNSASNNAEEYTAVMPVVIPEGSSQAEYSLSVENNASGYVVGYTVPQNSTNYSDRGFYSSGGTVLSKDEASEVVVNGQDVEGIDISLRSSSFIEGFVSLPGDYTAKGVGLEVTVKAVPADNSTSGFSKEVFIPKNEKTAEFRIGVPADSTKYILSYECTGDNTGYYEKGFYGSSGTVAYITGASQVPAESNEKYGLTLITPSIIKGVVTLPEGETAPQGGLKISVNAQTDMGTSSIEDDNYFSQEVNIPEGGSSAEYYISVLPDKQNYSIKYYLITDYKSYVKEGFYSTNGMVADEDKSTPVSVKGQVDNINLNLIKGSCFEGVVKLPDGQNSGNSGMNLVVSAICDNGTPSKADDYEIQTPVTIPPLANSCNFALAIEPKAGASYKIKYDIIDENSTYVNEGFLGLSGTVFNSDMAKALTLNGNTGGINLALVEGRKIQGILALPEGEKAPASGISVSITAETGTRTDKGGNGIRVSKMLKIGESESSVPFTLVVPISRQKYILSYEFITPGLSESYLEKVYYKKDGYVLAPALADKLDPSKEKEVSNIAFNIVETVTPVPEDSIVVYNKKYILGNGTLNIQDELKVDETGKYILALVSGGINKKDRIVKGSIVKGSININDEEIIGAHDFKKNDYIIIKEFKVKDKNNIIRIKAQGKDGAYFKVIIMKKPTVGNLLNSLPKQIRYIHKYINNSENKNQIRKYDLVKKPDNMFFMNNAVSAKSIPLINTVGMSIIASTEYFPYNPPPKDQFPVVDPIAPTPGYTYNRITLNYSDSYDQLEQGLYWVDKGAGKPLFDKNCKTLVLVHGMVDSSRKLTKFDDAKRWIDRGYNVAIYLWHKDALWSNDYVFNAFWTHGDRLKDELLKAIPSDYHNDLILAGHSAGGIVVTVAAYDMRDAGNRRPNRLVLLDKYFGFWSWVDSHVYNACKGYISYLSDYTAIEDYASNQGVECDCNYKKNVVYTELKFACGNDWHYGPVPWYLNSIGSEHPKSYTWYGTDEKDAPSAEMSIQGLRNRQGSYYYVQSGLFTWDKIWVSWWYWGIKEWRWVKVNCGYWYFDWGRWKWRWKTTYTFYYPEAVWGWIEYRWYYYWPVWHDSGADDLSKGNDISDDLFIRYNL